MFFIQPGHICSNLLDREWLKHKVWVFQKVLINFYYKNILQTNSKHKRLVQTTNLSSVNKEWTKL